MIELWLYLSFTTPEGAAVQIRGDQIVAIVGVPKRNRANELWIEDGALTYTGSVLTLVHGAQVVVSQSPAEVQGQFTRAAKILEARS